MKSRRARDVLDIGRYGSCDHDRIRRLIVMYKWIQSDRKLCRYISQWAISQRIERAVCRVDASQTAGVFPIDVQKMHIDVLCFTGHKGLLGPQGTGGMYVREGLEVTTAEERRKRSADIQ